ncbi:hypothetical protein PO909_033108 [Leuciscus waleckii]
MSAESSLNKAQGVKRKAPLANQQALDKLFSSQPSSKGSLAKLSKPLPFSIATLKQSLNLLSYQNSSSAQGLRLVNRLASHGAWVVLCGRKLMLLNPFRVEEALLFKRLLKNNILPTVSQQTPVPLTDGLLGGPEYMDVLLNMEKDSACFNGHIYFTDPRLVANGFEIRMIPGSSPSERHVEVTGMADCMPFFGIGDLREILQAIKVRDAKTVEQCRPLKVSNYLESEAVRLARQLPLNLSRADVTNTLYRMKHELEEESQTDTSRPHVERNQEFDWQKGSEESLRTRQVIEKCMFTTATDQLITQTKRFPSCSRVSVKMQMFDHTWQLSLFPLVEGASLLSERTQLYSAPLQLVRIWGSLVTEMSYVFPPGVFCPPEEPRCLPIFSQSLPLLSTWECAGSRQATETRKTFPM